MSHSISCGGTRVACNSEIRAADTAAATERNPLSARMKLAVHRLEPLLVDVGVNLRGRDVGVAEHLLDDPQVRAIAEQVGGEAVPEQVRIDIRSRPDGAHTFSRSARCGAVVSFVPRRGEENFAAASRFTSFGRSLET